MKLKGRHCKLIGLHFLLIAASLIIPVLFYVFLEETIMEYVSNVLGNAYARSINDTRTILPLMFIAAAAFLFTIINTIYAYDNSDAQDKLIKRMFYIFIISSFVAIGFLLYYIGNQFLTEIKYEKITDLTTRDNINYIFKKCVNLVVIYTSIIGIIFVIMDYSAIKFYKNSDKNLAQFASNQLYLIDIPLLIAAIVTYFLTKQIQVKAEWLDIVYSVFSIGLLVMQIIFSQITFFILRSKYVLTNA